MANETFTFSKKCYRASYFKTAITFNQKWRGNPFSIEIFKQIYLSMWIFLLKQYKNASFGPTFSYYKVTHWVKYTPKHGTLQDEFNFSEPHVGQIWWLEITTKSCIIIINYQNFQHWPLKAKFGLVCPLWPLNFLLLFCIWLIGLKLGSS